MTNPNITLLPRFFSRFALEGQTQLSHNEALILKTYHCCPKQLQNMNQLNTKCNSKGMIIH